MMQLEQMNINVRERGWSELYELAIRLCIRHAAPLALITLLGGAVLTVACWAPLILLPTDAVWGYLLAFPAWAVLLSTLCTLQSALVTAYVGQAMFSHRPRLGEALRMYLGRLGTVLAICAMRLFLTLPLGIGLLFHPIHLPECALLERQPFGDACRRAWRLYRFYNQENILHALLNLLGGVASLVVYVGCVFMAARILQLSGRPVWEFLIYIHPAYLWPLLVAPPLVTYFGVLRFCSYVDLRTRREGWELELEMRRAANRLKLEAA